ncbi:type IV toxin-antitoxin system AbiEi family antitoxin domain-containing protein [Deinococcus sp. SM5_A1]|uniref:type IV toxin-antitoxin system AbiEi family antitoxin domain-containing protein n=1 Tax=Deinococcus sp. SM5_A1 TaxID=3379094 RepID=UPI003857FF5C
MAETQLHNATRTQNLFGVADGQAGYFTAKQAEAAGYSRRMHHYHLSAGNWERVSTGLYRLRDYPRGDQDRYAELTLWSRDVQDRPQAVLGFETALRLHHLSDLDPAEIHLVVPPTFRKAAPAGVVLHRAELTARDTQDRGSHRVTTPLRTLTDALNEGRLSPEHLQTAVQDALGLGLVRKVKLKDALSALLLPPQRQFDLLQMLERS